MKIELFTFLEAIDNKIALLNHNDLIENMWTPLFLVNSVES